MPSFADDISRRIPSLRALARALVRGHCAHVADDLVQETLALALKAERVVRGSDIQVWCCSTLLRLHRHRNTSQGGSANLVREDRRGGAALSLLPSDVARLDRLPLEEREILLLAVVVGMNYARIAATLHLTVETVLQRLGNARQHLSGSGLPTAAAAGRIPSPRPQRPVAHLRVVK